MTTEKENRTAEEDHNVVLERKYFGAPMENVAHLLNQFSGRQCARC